MKSNANDAELIAEAYATTRRGAQGPEVIEEFLPAIAAGAARVAAPVAKKIIKKVGGAAVHVAKEVGKELGQKAVDAAGRGATKVGDAISSRMGAEGYPEDGEYEDCEAAAQGCTCTDCPDCESNGASAVDQEHSCGYDQVAEPEPQVSTIDESEMGVALADLHKAGKYAAALTDLLGNVGSLEGWTAVKIAKAADYLGAVFDKLDYDLNGHSVHNTGYEDAPTEDNQ